MDVEAGHNRDRGGGINVLQTMMLLTSFLTVLLSIALLTNLPVELLPGLRVFAIYGSLTMAMWLLVLGLAQPWARFSTATVTMLIVLDLGLALMAVAVTVADS